MEAGMTAAAQGASSAWHKVRHYVLATADLETLSGKLQSFLQIAPGFRNDMGEILGFRNEMMMIGQTMLEIVQPVKPDHRLHRWLAEHGGEGGYMIVLQTSDGDALRARAEQEKLRLTRDMLFRGQDLIQFDPLRFGTHLEAYRYSLPNGWWGDPVGRKYPQSAVAAEIAGSWVAVKSDPADVAAQVGRLFQSPVKQSTVDVAGKQIHFTQSDKVGLYRLDLVGKPGASGSKRATIGGVDWRIT